MSRPGSAQRLRSASMGALGAGLMLLAVAGAVGIARLSQAEAQPSAVPVDADFAAPPLQFTRLDGGKGSLAAYRGKVVLVNLWATWCPPCQREMPVMQQAQASNPDVNIVFVNQGEESRTIAAFLDRHSLVLRHVLVDPQHQTGAALGHRALPTTLFFDAEGRLADTRIGELSQATLTQRLTRLRAASPPKQQPTTP